MGLCPIPHYWGVGSCLARLINMRVLFLPHAVLAAGRSAGKCSPVLCGKGQGPFVNMGLRRTRLTGMQNLPVRHARPKVGLADNTCSHRLCFSAHAVSVCRARRTRFLPALSHQYICRGYGGRAPMFTNSPCPFALSFSFTASNPRCKSARMSSMCSVPMERRMVPGVMPWSASS